MDAHWLLSAAPWLRASALAAMLLPALFIACSRRAALPAKLAWALATQLPWAFVWLYLWLSQARYGGAEAAPPATQALGWWMLAFPWAVYLLYRATRSRYAGEPRPDPR